MKAFRMVLTLVVAGVIVLVAVARFSGSSERAAYRLRREALRREMVERSVVARGAGGPGGVEEARAVIRWWLDGAEALRGRFPGPSRDADRSPPRQDRKAAKAGKDAKDASWHQYAEERREALRAGYAPVLSASDQGLRIDILAIRAGEHPESHERGIRIDFALWGAPRRIDPEIPGEATRGAQRVVVPLSFRQLAFRFIDAAGKTYGEMTGSGEPYLVLKDPERFSGDLPPGIAFGTWWVEPFPREAARVEVSTGVQVQGTSGTILSPAFRWELPVAEEWKLRPGEPFRAETREAPPEAPTPR